MFRKGIGLVAVVFPTAKEFYVKIFCDWKPENRKNLNFLEKLSHPKSKRSRLSLIRIDLDASILITD
jgi:hypothetical protein